MVAQVELQEMIELHGWREIPAEIITREGDRVNTLGETWYLPYVIYGSAVIKTNKISNGKIRWAVQAYIVHILEIVSTHAGLSSFKDVWRLFLKPFCKLELANDGDVKEKLIEVIESAILKARADHKLWALYRPIQWYIWCAEHYPELGFCPVYAMELEGMPIPGNPKGEAVRMDDPDFGPLHRSLEVPLLIKAMRLDDGSTLEHLQQRAAVALSLAYGRNPANLIYLLESDLVDVTQGAATPCYVVRIPRIKKRQLSPRDDFIEERVEPELAKYLLALIHKNSEFDTNVDVDGSEIALPKPLFINLQKNRAALASGQWGYTYNMTSADITRMLQEFVERHRIISPLTGRPLYVTARRLRYTLATNLAAEGVSKRELARILDHTDTQHVQVYFELAGRIVEHLDKAAAHGFAAYIKNFTGRIVDSDVEAINGERMDKHLAFINQTNPTEHIDIGVCGEQDICHLDPPYSCYLCPKFQPYRHADHEHVLNCLLADRDARMKKYEKARIGVQLDDVIYAVTQVVQLCGRIGEIHG